MIGGDYLPADFECGIHSTKGLKKVPSTHFPLKNIMDLKPIITLGKKKSFIPQNKN